MLDELDEDVDTTHSRLRATQKKVRLMGACRKCRRAAGVAWVVGRGALHTAGCAQHKKREIGGFMLESQPRHRMAGRVEGVAVYSRLHATQKMVRA